MSEQAISSSSQGSDFFSTAFMVSNVGAPFIIGMAVGYFAKKMIKVALIIGGAALTLLFVSEYYGLITVNDTNLQNVATLATQATQQSGSFLVHRLSSITSKGVSAVTGFYFGLKLG
ncbi:MAG: FUN14 domain-containing protein [Methylococcaceae bacterium]|jgi:uncharacterized membrane protein (Fun14 family)